MAPAAHYEESKMNPKGHPATLQHRQPGNANARRSGVYSPDFLAEFTRPFIDEVMATAHIQPCDHFAAEETGRLRAWAAAMDDDLLIKGLLNRKGEPRTLLALRLRTSKQIERYLVELGLTPMARAKLGTDGGVAATYASLLAEEQGGAKNV
jgi:hypothetical protein